MRTTLDLEEHLVQEAMRLLGAKTKREAIESALQAVIAQKRRERLRTKLGRFNLALTLDQLEKMRCDERTGSD